MIATYSSSSFSPFDTGFGGGAAEIGGALITLDDYYKQKE